MSDGKKLSRPTPEHTESTKAQECLHIPAMDLVYRRTETKGGGITSVEVYTCSSQTVSHGSGWGPVLLVAALILIAFGLVALRESDLATRAATWIRMVFVDTRNPGDGSRNDNGIGHTAGGVTEK